MHVWLFFVQFEAVSLMELYMPNGLLLYIMNNIVLPTIITGSARHHIFRKWIPWNHNIPANAMFHNTFLVTDILCVVPFSQIQHLYIWLFNHLICSVGRLFSCVAPGGCPYTEALWLTGLVGTTLFFLPWPYSIYTHFWTSHLEVTLYLLYYLYIFISI